MTEMPNETRRASDKFAEEGRGCLARSPAHGGQRLPVRTSRAAEHFSGIAFPPRPLGAARGRRHGRLLELGRPADPGKSLPRRLPE
jgi:hypothetical protein